MTPQHTPNSSALKPAPKSVVSVMTPGVKGDNSNLNSPLFKQHTCMVCEDTGLIATAHQNSAGDYLNGRCWKNCTASNSVVWNSDQEQWVQPSELARFTLYKSDGGGKKPWVVEDNHCDPAEDAVLYHFTSKNSAERFKAQMESEHCKPTAPAEN